MLKGFKEFIFRGNVVELAVAVIIGGAFGAVVTSLVKDIFTPLIGSLIGQPQWDFKVGPVALGAFMTAVVSFLLVAVAVYLFIIVPLKRYQEKRKKEPPPAVAPEPPEDVKLLREIRDLLKKT